MTKEQRKWQAMRTTQGKLDFSEKPPSRIIDIPNIQQFRFDYTAVTTELFEKFAEESRNGMVTWRLNLRPFSVVDDETRTWKITGCVVTNDFSSTHTDRITADNLRHEREREFYAFKEFVSNQLGEIQDKCELHKLAFAKFSVPYRLGAQTETHRENNRAGTVSELAITGVIVRKTDNGLFERLLE